MIIYVEGADGTGKTTLAKFLSEITNIPLYTKSKSTDRVAVSYFAMRGTMSCVNSIQEDLVTLDIHHHLGFNAIFDRGIISGMAFYPMASKDYDMLKFLDAIAECDQIVVIHLECSYETASKRDESIQPELSWIQQAKRIKSSLLEDVKFVSATFNTDKMNHIEVLQEATAFLSGVFDDIGFKCCGTCGMSEDSSKWPNHISCRKYNCDRNMCLVPDSTSCWCDFYE